MKRTSHETGANFNLGQAFTEAKNWFDRSLTVAAPYRLRVFSDTYRAATVKERYSRISFQQPLSSCQPAFMWGRLQPALFRDTTCGAGCQPANPLSAGSAGQQAGLHPEASTASYRTAT